MLIYIKNINQQVKYICFNLVAEIETMSNNPLMM